MSDPIEKADLGYLIVLDDTHADPEYQFRWNKDDALLVAENATTESAMHYRMAPEEIDRSDCDGRYGFWFSAGSPCGSFRVTVREILIPPLDS